MGNSCDNYPAIGGMTVHLLWKMQEKTKNYIVVYACNDINIIHSTNGDWFYTNSIFYFCLYLLKFDLCYTINVIKENINELYH